MLSFLRIQNLAIIEETEISFSKGLNIISGDTGAGKSILLEAIELLCGKRASAELIRSGEKRCVVEAEFSVPEDKKELLLDLVPTLEDDACEEILLRRVVETNGKSRCFINGALSNLKQLQAVSSLLIDVTRQHAQQLLLKENEHRALLDAYGVKKDLILNVSSDYKEYHAAHKALEEFTNSAATLADRIRLLRVEHAELQDAEIKPGERKEVEEQLLLESNSESLMLKIQECLDLFGSHGSGIEQDVRSLLHLLDDAASLDPRLEEAKNLVQSASIELSEAALGCQDYQSSINADPQHLENLRQRLAIIARLERKYARPCDELYQYCQDIEQEISNYDSGAFDEQNLKKVLKEKREKLQKSEALLTENRKAVASKLSKKVEKELAQLNMKKARFEVLIEPGESSNFGADNISFRLAANPGEPFQSLTKVASGGELSRLLLVLKTIMAANLSPCVHVFDEIDSGIGGAVAQIVGEKLNSIAKCAQVIAVTHAPQVAAIAQNHLAVEKLVVDGRTLSRSKKLEEQERIAHIAGMLAGREVSGAFMDSARELLAHLRDK